MQSDGWRSGTGVTGKAWERNSYVIAMGAAVSDGTYDLTTEQQHRHAALAVVAGTPVQNARGKPLAVLSVSSEAQDGPLERPEGQALHLELAEVVARVLIDIGRLADD